MRRENNMNRLCPICSSGEKEFLYHQNFHNNVISLMEKYDVVACKSCGFVYADNIPLQTEFNDYYAAMSRYEFTHNDGIVSKSYMNHTRGIVDFLALHVSNKKARILDIGCSTGGLLSLLKERGYSNLIGMDPSPSCVRTIQQRYGIEAIASTISTMQSKEYFDVIILSAVLEHLVDLNSSVQKVASLLRPDGLLFIEIPDSERFYAYIFTPFQQFSIEHINYFTQYSIANLLSRGCFEITEMLKGENRGNQTIDPNFLIVSKKSQRSDIRIRLDKAGEISIRKYIAQCCKIDLEMKRNLREKLSKESKVIVWGVGTNTQRLLDDGLELSKVLYFVDSNINYAGKKLHGIDIKLPNEIKENAPILILTYSYQEEVIHQIRGILKLSNEILTIYKRVQL
jgi:SAM-dependent methyltransferase